MQEHHRDLATIGSAIGTIIIVVFVAMLISKSNCSDDKSSSSTYIPLNNTEINNIDNIAAGIEFLCIDDDRYIYVTKYLNDHSSTSPQHHGSVIAKMSENCQPTDHVIQLDKN